MNPVFNSLKEVIDSHKSHPFYQTHTWEGVELNNGIRGVERRKHILIDDIVGKNILDLGCSTGAETIWAIEMGAKKAYGLDKEPEKIKIANELIGALKKSLISENEIDLKCDQRDLSNELLLANWCNTVFCFAITQYLGYRKIWHEVPGASVIYVEGGGDSGYTEESLTDDKFIAKKIAMTPANNEDKRLIRPLFRLTRR